MDINPHCLTAGCQCRLHGRETPSSLALSRSTTLVGSTDQAPETIACLRFLWNKNWYFFIFTTVYRNLQKIFFNHTHVHKSLIWAPKLCEPKSDKIMFKLLWNRTGLPSIISCINYHLLLLVHSPQSEYESFIYKLLRTFPAQGLQIRILKNLKISLFHIIKRSWKNGYKFRCTILLCNIQCAITRACLHTCLNYSRRAKNSTS